MPTAPDRRHGELFALLFATFTVAVAYGFVLPVLPFLLEQRAGSPDNADVARHAGLLTAVYVAALFIFPPFWRRAAGRSGRLSVMVFGLVGLGSSLALFTTMNGIYPLYLGRFLDGFFASAVTPVALARIGARTPDGARRARQLKRLSVAAVAGFLAGPMVGALVAASAVRIGVEAIYDMPFLATAGIAYAAAVVSAFLIPTAASNGSDDERSPRETAAEEPRVRTTVVRDLLLVSLAVGAALGVFELTLAIRGARALDMSSWQIGLMFFECSAVMVIAQALLFSPLVKPDATRWLFMPALALTAGMLFFMPWATSPVRLFIVVSTVAASLGILYPISTYWISLAAGETQQRQLGRHAAAVSLGQALGSGGAGLLFGVRGWPEASAVVAIVLLLLVASAVRLPRRLAMLVARDRDLASRGRLAAFPIDAMEIEKGRRTHGPL